MAVSDVKKLLRPEASAMATLFQSSASSKLPLAFDPTRECVFAAQKKKKKAARVKPCKTTLFLLTGKESFIPRGAHRKKRGRIQKVEMTRVLSPQGIKNKIIVALKEQPDFESAYHLLTQEQNGKLTFGCEQFPNGEEFVSNALKHRGNVYLVPAPEVCIVCHGLRSVVGFQDLMSLQCIAGQLTQQLDG